MAKPSDDQHRGRPTGSSPYYRLQIGCDRKNRTRWTRPEEPPDIQEAIDGDTRFRDLVDRYAAFVVAETGQRMDDPAKEGFC